MNIGELSNKRIYILDFRTGSVFVRFVPLSMVELDANEIVLAMEDELEIRESDCNYMVTDRDLVDDNTHIIYG